MSKVIVIGLEGIKPSILFSLLEDLPHFKKLIDYGFYGKIQGTVSSSQIPFWCSLITGLDPGQLGIYGSYQRSHHDQYKESIVDSSFLKEPPIWDILGKHGYQSIIMGVPLYLPSKSMIGCLITCPYTNPNDVRMYPESLEEELTRALGANTLETRDSLHQVNKNHFTIARYLLDNKKWDFFMMVDSSLKQFQTFSWDQSEQLYNLYRRLDRELGTILNIVPQDTKIVLVSGYENQNVEGVFHLNEWLQQEGYLKLKEAQEKPIMLSENLIDWKQTRAWGKGGTYGSIFLNVKRRESQGVIPKEKYEYIQNRLIHKIVSLTDSVGIPLYAKIFKPSKVFSKNVGVSADLYLNFRNLYWRASSLIGTGEIHSRTVGLHEKVNLRPEGMIITADLTTKHGKRMDAVQTIDLAPTILRLFEISPPKSMIGTVVFTEGEYDGLKNG